MTQSGERRDRDVIAKRCAVIRSEYLDRVQRQKSTKADKTLSRRDKVTRLWEHALGYLKIETYALARHCSERGWGRHIQRMADHAATASQRKIGGFDDDPFHWTLLAIESPKLRSATRQGVEHRTMELPDATRSRIASELRAADRCDVPIEFLLGFLSQAGGEKVCRSWNSRADSPMFERFRDLMRSYDKR